MRTIDADVVLAALFQIEDDLNERDSMPNLRVSNAKQRVRSLVQQIENQAAPAQPNGSE